MTITNEHTIHSIAAGNGLYDFDGIVVPRVVVEELAIDGLEEAADALVEHDRILAPARFATAEALSADTDN